MYQSKNLSLMYYSMYSLSIKEDLIRKKYPQERRKTRKHKRHILLVLTKKGTSEKEICGNNQKSRF